MKFHKGAAQVAIRVRQDITPVLIRSNKSNLEKGGTWYLAPREPIKIHMEVRGPIHVDPFLAERPDHPALAARALNAHLQEYFNREVTYART